MAGVSPFASPTVGATRLPSSPARTMRTMGMMSAPTIVSTTTSPLSEAATTMAAEMMGSDYVFSRKPDLRRTYDAARDCVVELLFRDVYDVGGDRSRLARWVSLVKSVFDI